MNASSSKEDIMHGDIKMNKIVFNSVKTFDNIYVENKSEILKYIDFFMNNEDYYKSHGIPYTLGMLFHGDPGCGKSSFIKALANHFHRHILNINLAHVTSMNELDQLFYMTFYEEIDLHNHKKIILLEDIDAMDSIVNTRAKKPGGGGS